MFFYRELPPSNIPPNQANLMLWFDGKNIDGSNNSTLTDGGLVPTTVNNLGTSGGSWTSNNGTIPGNYIPYYNSSPPSMKITSRESGVNSGYSTRVLGDLSTHDVPPVPNSPNIQIPGGANAGKAAGFLVFSVGNVGLTNNFPYGGDFFWRGDNTYLSWDPTNKFRIYIGGFTMTIDFTPTTNKRYCLSWQFSPPASGPQYGLLTVKINGNEFTGTPFISPDPWSFQAAIGANWDSHSQTVLIESLGVYQGDTTSLSEIETWATNYYGALG